MIWGRREPVEHWVHRVWMDFQETKEKRGLWDFLDSGDFRVFQDCPDGRGPGVFREVLGSQV